MTMVTQFRRRSEVGTRRVESLARRQLATVALLRHVHRDAVEIHQKSSLKPVIMKTNDSLFQ